MEGRATSERVAIWLIRRRWLVLGLAAVLSVVAGYRTVLTYAALRSDLEELLPETAPSVTALSTLRERLPGLRHLGVVVDTGGAGNVEAAERFLQALAARVRKYPPGLVGAARTDLVAERRFGETYLLQLMDPADVRRLREAVEKRRDWEVTRETGIDLMEEGESPAPELPIDELRKKYEVRFGAGKGDLDGDRFVSKDGRTAVLLIQTSSHATSYESDEELLARVKADVVALGFPDKFAKGMRIGYAGDVATRVEETEGLVSDLSVSGVLVFLLVVGSIIAFYRSWRALPILAVPLACGTLCAFGVVALPPLSIRHLNSNTAFLGSIVVGNGINSGIMLLARFQEEQRGGADLDRAIATALRTTWRPTLAAALAAATAYGSLVLTNFRGFNQFGWIGGLGMVLCWTAMMLLVPPMASLIGGRMTRPARGPARRRALGRLLPRLLSRPGVVLVATLVLAAVALSGIVHRSGSWFEYDFSKLRRRAAEGTGERYWGKRMDDTLRRYLTPTVIMAGDARQAAAIEQRVRDLAKQGGAGGLIASVRSAKDILPDTRAQAVEEAKKLKAVMTPHMRGELSEKDRQLVDRALGDSAMHTLEPSELPDALVAGLREYDGRIDREVLVFPKLSEGTWDADRMAAYARDLRTAASVDGQHAPVAGSLLLSSDIVTAMKSDGPRATALSLGAVLVICVLSFRSVALSLLAVASLFIGVTIMLGSMAWSGMRLNFSNFVTLPITFGIAADYSINMLKRYQSEGRLDFEAALASTGGAVALCSATTIIGFGSLLVAQNMALFSFGVFAVAGEVACLATAVIVLPAATLLAARRRKG